MTDQQPDKPGRYESPFDEYPGYVQFPAPLMLHHVQAWWEKAVEPLANKKRVDYAYWDAEWQAAKALILQFGAWRIESVPQGEVDADRVPAEVVGWVLEVADEYVGPKLPPKMRRLARSVS